MKKLNFSLAALCAFAYSANAQSLEDAIKGVEVGGFLRYEYEDNRFKNQLFQDGANGDGTAEHTWRTEAEFKTPVQNNVALALGIYYETSNNVNHGKGSPANAPDSPSNFLGDGLGSGKDGEFGVSTFYATVAPDFTSTNITLGKMRLDTPLNDNEEDRGTGILAVNSDIPNVSLVAGAFDSWALDDLSETFPEQSIAKPLYTLAALANYELGIGNLEAQAWIFHIDDILDSSIFAQLSFNHALFHLSAQYAYANLNNQGFESLLGAGEYQNKGDFISLEAGIDLESLKIPLQLSVGYITNTQDNFGVSLDNEGALQLAGAVWFDNYDGTGIDFSAIGSAIPRDTQKDLDVIYARASYALLENLSVGIDYISGTNKVHQKSSATSIDYDFYEVMPNITWQLGENIEIFTYYALLKTEQNSNDIGLTKSENRNQFKVEAVYSF